MKRVFIVVITLIHLSVMAQQKFSDGYKFTISSGLLNLDTVKNTYSDTLSLKPIDTLKSKDTVRSEVDK